MPRKKDKKEVYQPDDNFFKIVMEDKANARAYLKEFYPELSKNLDLRTLSLEKESFLTEEFKLFKSDIIYRCKFSKSDKQVNLVLLWENKSRPDKYVAVQLGLYLFLAMHKMVQKKELKLEPIIPLVFYNGKQKWKPQRIGDLFSKHPYHKVIKAFLPDFDFLFKNITEEPPEQLVKIKTAFLRSAMIAMANKHRVDLYFRDYSFIFELEQNQLTFLFTYVCAVTNKKPAELREDLINIELNNKNRIMSTLEMLLEEGREIGSSLKNFEIVLNLVKNVPDMSATSISKSLNVPTSFVKEVKTAKVSKNKEHFLQIIHKKLFAKIYLSEKDHSAIETLVDDFLF